MSKFEILELKQELLLNNKTTLSQKVAIISCKSPKRLKRLKRRILKENS